MPDEWNSKHLTDALQCLVVQLDNEPSLIEPNQLRKRLEALHRLDAYFPYAPHTVFGAESIEPELYRRVEAICARLEAVNRQQYAAIRSEIRRRSRPDSLLRWVHPSPDMEDEGIQANGMGYDYLDELISGILSFKEPDAGHITRDSEKVFYQPTPARHIFSLIGLTALTAADVFVDLGSGLGHVPLLISICTPARSVGIELEANYVERARQCARALNLTRVTFTHEDARAADLSVGTVFYLYTPFTGSILSAMLSRLRHEATTRQIRICSFGPCTSVIAEEPWLEAAATPNTHRITLFSSHD